MNIFKLKLKKYLRLLLKGIYLESRSPVLEAKSDLTGGKTTEEQLFVVHVWNWHPVQILINTYHRFYVKQEPNPDWGLFTIDKSGNVIEL